MWTIFKEQIEIDAKQMDIMRGITYHHKGNEEPMYNNYREVQLENGRKILDVDLKHQDGTPRFGNSSPTPLQASLPWIVFVSFAALIYIMI